MFDLLFLDYFRLFIFVFILSVHLELTSKSGDQKLLKELFGHTRYCKLDFL